MILYIEIPVHMLQQLNMSCHLRGTHQDVHDLCSVIQQ